jgi:hypothetical protein
MNHRQIDLIPVSPHEFTGAAVELSKLLQQVDDEEAAWDDAKTEHRETIATLKQGIANTRRVIERWCQEQQDVVNQQVNALLSEADEER